MADGACRRPERGRGENLKGGAGALVRERGRPDRVRRRRYEQPLVAPQDGQAWHEPARCMMSPHTWQITTSRDRAFGALTGGAGGAVGAGAGAVSAADGGWWSSGRSSEVADGVVASSTPGSVGCMRSPTDRMPIASRL